MADQGPDGATARVERWGWYSMMVNVGLIALHGAKQGGKMASAETHAAESS